MTGVNGVCPAPLKVRSAVKFERMLDGRAVYAVGSGEYHFLSPAAR